MKTALLVLLLAVPFAAFAQTGETPSDRAFERHEREAAITMNQPVPVRPPKLDLQKIRTEADELAKLAQTVRPQIDQAEKGALPKGLSENLKKMEKLSKKLRRDLLL